MGISDIIEKVLPIGTPEATVEQQPLQTPEQMEARRLLLDFARSGQYGKWTAGEDLGLPTGYFKPTGLETESLSQLEKLLQGGMPDLFAPAGETFRGMMDVSAEGIDRQFQPFKTLTQRGIAEASDAAKRESAFAGNLYGSKTIEKLGDVQTRGQEIMQSKLADLYGSAMDRALSAARSGVDLGVTEEGIRMGRIGAGTSIGALDRLLRDAESRSKYNEALRRREELLRPIDAAVSVSGTPVDWGVQSYTEPGVSALEKLLSISSQLGSQYLASRGFMGA